MSPTAAAGSPRSGLVRGAITAPDGLPALMRWGESHNLVTGQERAQPDMVGLMSKPTALQGEGLGVQTSPATRKDA